MLVLIRHPKVAVAPGICYGRLDVALAADADLGRIAAEVSGRSGFTLWTSPARRCAMVAGVIAQAHGMAAREDDRLRELDFGAWEGMAWSDVPRQALDRWAACPAEFAPPGGESGAALVARVTAFHHEIRAQAGGHVVVSHGGPLRLLVALAQGWAPDLLASPPALGAVLVFDAWRSGATRRGKA